MQWLNENDDVSLEYLHGAFSRDKKEGVSDKSYEFYLHESRYISDIEVFNWFSHFLLTVPKEQRARALQRFRRRRLHTTDAMLRRGIETRVSRSGDLEEVHEEIREDHRQGSGGLCGYSEERIPQPSEGRTNRTFPRMTQSIKIYESRTDLIINRLYSTGMHSDEQYPTTSSAIGEDVRVNGRRQARGRRGKYIEGITTTAERRSG